MKTSTKTKSATSSRYNLVNSLEIENPSFEDPPSQMTGGMDDSFGGYKRARGGSFHYHTSFDSYTQGKGKQFVY